MTDETLFSGDWCKLFRHPETDWSISAYGAPGPRYSVRYGDAGWECDPGTERDSRDRAIRDVEMALADLHEILRLLRAEPHRKEDS